MIYQGLMKLPFYIETEEFYDRSNTQSTFYSLNKLLKSLIVIQIKIHGRVHEALGLEQVEGSN
jgi:hypothetical protein